VYLVHGGLACELDGGIGQIADNGFNVTPDITHLGKLGGLNLDEGGVGETSQTTGDLCFADAGGTDHQNIFRCDFGTQFFIHLHAPPAVTQGNGNGALGGILSDNMFVQFLDDFSGSHFGHIGINF